MNWMQGTGLDMGARLGQWSAAKNEDGEMRRMALKTMTGDQFFEDFAVGDTFRGNSFHFTEERIIEFAKQYDPQPFHLDSDVAGGTHFDGLIASGWQTMCVTFGGMIEAGFMRGGGMGSPGLTDLKWTQPVRPGDSVFMQATVTDLRTSSKRPDRGYVTFDFEAINQNGTVVMCFTCAEILRRSPDG